MSTKTVITYSCDACAARGQDEVEAVASHTIAVDEVRVVLDFCATHEAGLVGALRDVALSRGRSVPAAGGPRPKGHARVWAELACPECGRHCVGAVGLSAHRRAAHGLVSR